MKYWDHNADGELVEYYGMRSMYSYFVPALTNVTPTSEIRDKLLAYRLELIHSRDSLLEQQKFYAKEKRFDIAKIYGTLARDELKLYRALCLFIPWFVSDYPNDCRVVSQRKWPLGLEYELDCIGNTIEVWSW